MTEADLWVQWWAFPWRKTHPDWRNAEAVVSEVALTRSRHSAVSKAFSITPCLPCAPSASLVYLALAQPSQHGFMLQLVDHICRPRLPGQLNATQRLWCQRLATGLHTQSWLQPTDDTLQLLRAWVEPHVWQRLRLRFAPPRIMAMEQKPPLDIRMSRLEVLWQPTLQQHAIDPQDATTDVHR